MNFTRIVFAALLLSQNLASASDSKELFNGKNLEGWTSYLGPRYDKDKKDFDGPAVGANHDPYNVFDVVEIDNAPAIRISGEVWGSLTSVDEYENYHLRLQFKWGEKRFVPRENSKRDSGLLYHSIGPDAVGWFFWKRSQEFQVQENDTGDYWAVGGVSIKAHVRTEATENETDYLYSPTGDLKAFRSGAEAGGHIRRSFDAELEHGKWNTLDLYCLGQTSMHVVNGVLVSVLRESEQPDGNGNFIPLSKGKIQLQSEGAEVYYRSITIEPIHSFPNISSPRLN